MVGPLLVKEPCSRGRHLLEHEIPPQNEMHNISAYPRYYTPLWTPFIFVHIFHDIKSLIKWIQQEFAFMAGGVAVEPGMRALILYSRSCLWPAVSLSFQYIASSDFYPEDVVNDRLNFARSYPPSLTYYNPQWLFYASEHYQGSLAGLTLTELKAGVSHVHNIIYTSRTKAQCSLILMDYFADFVREICTKTDEELRVSCLLIRPGAGEPAITDDILSYRYSKIYYLLVCRMGRTVGSRLCIPDRPHPSLLDPNQRSSDVELQILGGVSNSVQVSALNRIGSKLLTVSIRQLHPCHRSIASSDSSSASILVDSFRQRLADLMQMSSFDVRNTWLSWEPMYEFNCLETRIDCIRKILMHEYGSTVAWTLLNIKPRQNKTEKTSAHRTDREFTLKEDHGDSTHDSLPDTSWPTLVEPDTVRMCLNDYVKALEWKAPPTCAACSRSREDIKYHTVMSDSPDKKTLCLEVLRARNPSVIKIMKESNDTSTWKFKDLDQLMLDSAGVHQEAENIYKLTLCSDCNSSLTSGKVPRLSLANNLYRGSLPSEFRDMTWVEEMICAKHLNTAIVVRLVLGHDGHKATMLKGNTCAHEMNIVKTAKALPRTPVDINDMLSVVFLGSSKPDAKQLKWMFFVRRKKIWNFLMWLKDHNEMYSDITVDSEAVQMYPEDDILPGMMERIIVHKTDAVDKIYEEETASITPHPSELLYMRKDRLRDNNINAYIEKVGVSDPELISIHGRNALAAGVKNLITRTTSTTAGLEVYRGSQLVSEYDNSALLPGMYPTLFPYGIGGFDDKTRRTGISFIAQAELCLDVADRRFRYHHSFMFVVLNIHQRRTGHLHTSLTVKRSYFDEVAKSIESVTPEMIKKLAENIQNENGHEKLNEEEKKVMAMLKHVNTISSKIPGSAASKTLCRNEIRSYVGIMGVPQIFLTINPSPHNHPVFMLMYGDQSVNLNERYPQLAEPPERARRLTHDPVAAADFFDRCIKLLFSHMFGWDFEAGKSTRRGGILGRLKGFYGTAEYTERGVLHGHFLAWMEGGMNPSQVHAKMKDDKDFQERFFLFFEDIIKHELPDTEVTPGFNPKTYIPATEMPPKPLPDSRDTVQCTSTDIEDWNSMFSTEVAMCAETLQRHTCKEVCHKYGNDDRCRFRFPHEVVPVSYFDPDSNSINLRCTDATLNYYNPYILVYCRHNHDIRCILSGKSAKAAMFYITDYITKMSLKTSQMLSLMCEAVMTAPKVDNASAVDNAKTLLHKCLSQFTRKQQIHAQQAARYLRRACDSMKSHATIPIMSNLAYVYNKNKYSDRVSAGETDESDAESHKEANFLNDNGPTDDMHVVDDGEECDLSVHDSHTMKQAAIDGDIDDVEEMSIEVSVREDGKVVSSSQFDDYMYRDEKLKNISFIDFVCFFEREKRTGSKRSERANTRKRFDLQSPHPLYISHEIVERSVFDFTDMNKIQAIPRVVGMSIPRASHGDSYRLFIFSHFVPYSHNHDPVPDGVTLDDFLKTRKFTDDDKKLMDNWEVIYECEDARDADRLAQQERYMLESRQLNDALTRKESDNGEEGVELFAETSQRKTQKNIWIMDVIRKLRYARYLNPPMDASSEESMGNVADDAQAEAYNLPRNDELWEREIDQQMATIASLRENLLHVHEQSMHNDHTGAGEARRGELIDSASSIEMEKELRDDAAVKNVQKTNKKRKPELGHAKAVPPDSNDLIRKSPEDTMRDIINKHDLNEKQSIAFLITAKSWLRVHKKRESAAQPDSDNFTEEVPLRLLMTGPGGTGKSHSIKALKEFMEYYGSGHRLRLLAPTGSAASLIDGMTCHKGLALKVTKSKAPNRDIQRTSLNERYTLSLAPRRKNEMRKAWKNVDVVLIDEVSLLSLQQLTDIDHALRLAKEKPDEWFGGIIIIFSGDFCQYPPVGGNPLYTCIRTTRKMQSDELKKRLGRLAWKTLNAVVEFTEQFRMKEDPEYASAVGRLRLRCCTEQDVSLFNSRVIKSIGNPDGPDMSLEANSDATMIVPTNDLRERVNEFKAETVCEADQSKRLLTCNALDYIGKRVVPVTPHKNLRKDVLDLRTSGNTREGALPGRILLFEGMPVILRGKNLAVDLRVANGSQGLVHKVYTETDEYGLTYASLVLVRFPDSTVKLSGLPQGVFPIKPVTWRFLTTLETESGKFRRCSVKRQQLPIQPGYCVTGHSAQGKTLAKVLCHLCMGSWAAYVAASRARRRDDLYLLKEVELKDLNRNLPADLKAEMKRYEILEYNTMIKYGFAEGQLKPVPDAEDRHVSPESNIYVGNSGNLVWTAVELDSERTKAGQRDNEIVPQTLTAKKSYHDESTKEKVDEAGHIALNKSNYTEQSADKNHESVVSEIEDADMTMTLTDTHPLAADKFRRPKSLVDAEKKRPPCGDAQPSRRTIQRTDLIQTFQGCVWDSLNWSCAYDALFMILWLAYAASGHEWKQLFKHYNLYTKITKLEFDSLGSPIQNPTPLRAQAVNASRDHVRDYISDATNGQFPRNGPVAVSAQELGETIIDSHLWSLKLIRRQGYQDHEVSSCHRRRRTFWRDIYDDPLHATSSIEHRHTHQCWITASCTLTEQNVWPTQHDALCADVAHTPFVLTDPPLVLWLNHTETMGASVLPVPHLQVPTPSGSVSYYLAGIIYLGGLHFTSRLMWNNSIYTYDGQVQGGQCVRERRFALNQMSNNDWAALATLGTRRAHMFVYRRE